MTSFYKWYLLNGTDCTSLLTRVCCHRNSDRTLYQAKKQTHFQVITNKHCAAQPVVYWRVNSLAPSLKKKLQ